MSLYEDLLRTSPGALNWALNRHFSNSWAVKAPYKIEYWVTMGILDLCALELPV